MKRQKLSPEERKRNEKEKRLYKTYGIKLKDWEDRYKAGCEVCGRTEGVLCIDHMHVKGFKKMSPDEKRKYIRGLACFMCNTGFKAFEKTIDGNRNRRQLEGTYKYFSKYALKGEF